MWGQGSGGREGKYGLPIMLSLPQMGPDLPGFWGQPRVHRGIGSCQEEPWARSYKVTKRFRGSWETNPHFSCPRQGKIVLEGRLALTPSCCPFFLGFASVPGCCRHLLQEVFTDALSLGEASFPDFPIIPIPDSNDTLCLFGSVPQQWAHSGQECDAMDLSHLVPSPGSPRCPAAAQWTFAR